MKFPILSGWPNQGVGRVNPDGSLGSCTSCHSRHKFSIEMARKPYTCAECHKGPDVPGYKVYMVSKHGNIYSSISKDWNFKNVPWVIGKDFKAPTCATCHVSLIVDENGNVIVNRTHKMNDRIPWRIWYNNRLVSKFTFLPSIHGKSNKGIPKVTSVCFVNKR